jgi:phage gp36-like protein
MFLRRTDYSALISDNELNVITKNNDTNRLAAESAAQEEVSSYLRGKYDVAGIFIPVIAWTNIVPFATGAQIEYNNVLYHALQDSTGNDPEAAESEYWKSGDLRNQLIMRLSINIAIYQLSHSNASRNVPEFREKNYLDAIKWLENVAKGRANPSFPLAEETTNQNTLMRTGFKDRSDMSW